jgi:hypothetical protein
MTGKPHELAEDFDHVIILCYSDKLNVQQADKQILITPLQPAINDAELEVLTVAKC